MNQNPNKLSNKSFNSKSSSQYLNVNFSPNTPNNASTPSSVLDDEIWFEFLQSLNQPIQTNSYNNANNSENSHNLNSDTNVNTSEQQQHQHNQIEYAYKTRKVAASTAANTTINSLASFVNSSIDNDDATDDPDFTVCLDNCDLDDPDYIDDWYQVPSIFSEILKALHIYNRNILNFGC
jgi:hypothetical protein